METVDLSGLQREVDKACMVIDKLREEKRQLLNALRDISEGRGRFSLDNFEHARNTIEDMKKLALDAIAKIEEERQSWERTNLTKS